MLQPKFVSAVFQVRVEVPATGKQNVLHMRQPNTLG